MKILIEIDTDTQRVVPVQISEDMHIAAAKVLARSYGIDGTPQRMLDAICATAPQPEPVDAIANFLHQFKRHVGGDGEFWLHELEDFYDAISQGEQK